MDSPTEITRKSIREAADRMAADPEAYFKELKETSGANALASAAILVERQYEQQPATVDSIRKLLGSLATAFNDRIRRKRNY